MHTVKYRGYTSLVCIMNIETNMIKLLGVSKIHGNSKMTIPKELRDHLNIEDGDFLKFTLENGKVNVKKVEP